MTAQASNIDHFWSPVEANPPLTAGQRQAIFAAISVSDRRVDIPVRNSFVRSPTGETRPPLAQLVAGRSGVALKLYLAVIWRCARAPFNTEQVARHWAEMLALPDPSGGGARRIRDALETLQTHQLVRLEKRRGLPTVVHLLREDGSGAYYEVPHASRQAAKAKLEKAEHQYFKIPQSVWSSGHLQRMSTPALAMLLVVLEESRGENDPQWWAVETFAKRFGLKKDARAHGTSELAKRRLLRVTSEALPPSPGSHHYFNNPRTRRKYQLMNQARLDFVAQQ